MKIIEEFVKAGGVITFNHIWMTVSAPNDEIKYMRLPVSYAFAEEGSSEHDILKYYLQILINLNKKSPQQLSAEESVKKAEDALKAAKEVLSKIKEV